MLYRIYSSSIWCSDKDKENAKILGEYPCLKDFGMKLVEYEDQAFHRIRDENGKYISQPVTKVFYRIYIELNTLEEFQKLQAAIDQPLIFFGDEIEIYDGYRE